MYRWWNIFPLLLWLTVSCEKQFDGYGTVSFSVEDHSFTKSSAGASTSESLVKNISYFLFDTDTGVLIRYVTTVSKHVVMSGVPYGNLTIYAVANVDVSTFGNVRSLDDLKTTAVLHYASSFKGVIPMKAKMCFTLDAETKSISLSLERYMARLRLIRLCNRLEGPSEGEDIILKRAYLTNLQGGFYVDMYMNTSIWYSKYGRSDFSPSESSYITSESHLVTGEHTFRSLGDECVIPGKEVEFNTLQPFYAFPNYACLDDTGWGEGVFQERFTRMILVAEIKGEEYYYPINLVNMTANVSHDIVYVITRLGSDDPDTFGFVELQDNVIDFEDMENEGEIEIEF